MHLYLYHNTVRHLLGPFAHTLSLLSSNDQSACLHSGRGVIVKQPVHIIGFNVYSIDVFRSYFSQEHGWLAKRWYESNMNTIHVEYPWMKEENYDAIGFFLLSISNTNCNSDELLWCLPVCFIYQYLT